MSLAAGGKIVFRRIRGRIIPIRIDKTPRVAGRKVARGSMSMKRKFFLIGGSAFVASSLLVGLKAED